MTMIIRMMTIARLTFRPCLKVNNSTISLLFNQLFYSSHHHHGHSSNFLLESFGSKKSSSRKIKEQSPNYFFCVRVNNNQIIDLVHKCQKEIQKANPLLSSSFVNIQTLHITLFAFHIDLDRFSLDYIRDYLTQNKSELLRVFKPNDLVLKFSGLSHFRNQVVYVDLIKDDCYHQLKQLQLKLVEIYSDKLGVTLSEKNFKPHMTLMKLSKSKDLYRKGIKKIDASVYESLIATEFGHETIQEIHLCSIGEKQPDGFYRTEDSLHFK